jgi:hypothetical protein
LAFVGGREERQAVPHYGEPVVEYGFAVTTDTLALWPKLAPHMNLDHALLRGEYMKSVALMEARGIPVDNEMLRQLEKTGWA